MRGSDRTGADGITPEDRVRREVLTRLLHGNPVDLASLSVSTRLPEAAVEEAMAALHAGGAIYRAGGVVVAAYPLSGVPTRHRLRFGGRRRTRTARSTRWPFRSW